MHELTLHSTTIPDSPAQKCVHIPWSSTASRCRWPVRVLSIRIQPGPTGSCNRRSLTSLFAIKSGIFGGRVGTFPKSMDNVCRKRNLCKGRQNFTRMQSEWDVYSKVHLICLVLSGRSHCRHLYNKIHLKPWGAHCATEKNRPYTPELCTDELAQSVIGRALQRSNKVCVQPATPTPSSAASVLHRHHQNFSCRLVPQDTRASSRPAKM